jgi:hypothetical protein
VNLAWSRSRGRASALRAMMTLHACAAPAARAPGATPARGAACRGQARSSPAIPAPATRIASRVSAARRAPCANERTPAESFPGPYAARALHGEALAVTRGRVCAPTHHKVEDRPLRAGRRAVPAGSPQRGSSCGRGTSITMLGLLNLSRRDGPRHAGAPAARDSLGHDQARTHAQTGTVPGTVPGTCPRSPRQPDPPRDQESHPWPLGPSARTLLCGRATGLVFMPRARRVPLTFS